MFALRGAYAKKLVTHEQGHIYTCTKYKRPRHKLNLVHIFFYPVENTCFFFF